MFFRLNRTALALVLIAACTTPAETTTTAPETTTTSSVPEATTTTAFDVCARAPDTANPNPPETDMGDAPEGNQAPSIVIVSPDHLSRHQMELNSDENCFEVTLQFISDTTDPDSDDFTVEWFSSDEGFLGTGEEISATLHTIRSDTAQPTITARATDEWGAVSEAEIQILVWIPSDT